MYEKTTDIEILPSTFHFPRLQHLTISGNISKLNNDSLNNLNYLKTLSLSHNNITEIPDNLFASTPLLETLDLSWNRLRNPTSLVFSVLRNLKELDISHNRITHLHFLENTYSIEKLFVSHNAIFGLQGGQHPGVFAEVHNVIHLDLSYNNLMGNKSLFITANIISDLNLAGNNLKSISAFTFKRLTHVLKLNLSECGIEHFLFSMLVNSDSETIQISRRIYKQVRLGLFLSPLVSDFRAYHFSETRGLEVLDLSHNKLTYLSDDLFMNNTNLQHLNISHNALSRLPTYIFQRTPLKSINLSHNKIEIIQPKLLNQQTLENVYLEHNHIVYLNPSTFATDGFPIKYMDLRFNRLVYLDPDFFYWLANLQTFELSGNPWDCICLDNILRLLHARFIDFTKDDYFEGKRPVCVVFNNNTCSVENSTLSNYYERFVAS